MKKFLSLVLALVMTMSLVTVSAGAKDFTDDSKINYPEAVDVISAVKVVDGYTDGSFNPQATLTRGAAAKIICNLILGPTTAAALSADTAPYKDVPTNHVFAGYIAYCQQQGIISGYADGSFRPAATLTGYAFMKMLLGALGYDSEIEGYVGNNWSIAVAKRALNIGLDDGIEGTFVGTKAVTREEACLFAFNMLNAHMVDYASKGTNITVGGTTIQQGASKPEEGKLFRVVYFEDLSVMADTADVFGRPANKWYLKNDKIGTYTKDADVIYTSEIELGDIYADLGLKDTTYFEYYVNGEHAGEMKTDKDGKKYFEADVFAVKRGDSTKKSDNGIILEVYEDAQVVVAIETYVGEIGEVVEANKRHDAYVVVDALQKGEKAGKFETEGFDVDDIVLYTYADGEVQSVVAAESVTGEVTKYVSGKNFTMDGETYTYAFNNDVDFGGLAEYVVYFDEYGYAVYMTAVDSLVKDMYYVLQTAQDEDNKWHEKGDVEARLLSVDGTVITVTLKDEDDAAYKGDFVTIKEKDGKYDLRAVNSTSFKDEKAGVIGSEKTKNDIKAIENGKTGKLDGKYAYNNATIFLLYSAKDKEAKVYTGFKAVPTVTVKAGKEMDYDVLTKKSNGAASVVVLFTDDATKTAAITDTLYILKNDDPRMTVTEDAEWFEYTAVVDGAEQTILLEADKKNVELNKVIDALKTQDVLVVDYTLDGDKITDLTLASAEDHVVSATTVTEYEEGVMTIGTKVVAADPDAVKVVKIDADGNISTISLTAVRTDNDSEKKNKYEMVTAVLDEDEDNLQTLFVRENAEKN